MTGRLGKTTNWGREIVGTQAQSEREDMWGPIPGRTVSFDPATQTATIQPLYKPRFNGQPVDMPQLLEVPVDIPRTGSGAITMPIPTGTRVVLTPMMRSMENYDTDDDGAPSDTRSFSLSDMRASIAGGESASDPLQNYDPDNLHIRANADGSYGMKMSPNGKISIEGAEGNVYGLLAQAIRLIAEDGLAILSGSSAGVGIHALQNRAALMAIADKLEGMQL